MMCATMSHCRGLVSCAGSAEGPASVRAYGGTPDALQQQAELYLCLGQVMKAVRLWSAAEMLYQTLGASILPSYRSRYEHALARARAAAAGWARSPRPRQ